VIQSALARKPIDRPTRPATILRSLIELSYESSIMATALDVAEALATVIPAPRLSGKAARRRDPQSSSRISRSRAARRSPTRSRPARRPRRARRARSRRACSPDFLPRQFASSQSENIKRQKA